jgi:purine nucleoside permease
MDSRVMTVGANQLAALLLAALLGGCQGMEAQRVASGTARAQEAASATRAVKVLIITMFDGEALPWTQAMPFTDAITVPGLSADYPVVRCTASDVCIITTGMGHSNAAASTMAVVLSRRFDLSRTYFLVAGIAGIDPNVGTIGAATWARYLVDYGIAHEIDAREMPPAWTTGYFGIHAARPEVKPELNYRTEIFQLDEALLQKALKLTANVKLEDNDTARAYRARYAEAAARRPPSVLQCDTAAGDTYWHGKYLGEWATRWTTLLTEGKGRYCTTQQEDNATYESLKRGAAAGLLDLRRVTVLRTASNFDRPHQDQSAYDSLKSTSGGFAAATKNLVVAGKPLVDDIVGRWTQWQAGVPAPYASRPACVHGGSTLPRPRSLRNGASS